MNVKATNLQLSVKQRLLNISKQRKEDFQFCLTRYAIERFLYRLSESRVVDRFILKGALLLMAWTAQPYRPTKDLDLMGHGEPIPEVLKGIITEICQTDVIADGLLFDIASIAVSEIREDQEFQGQRIRLNASLGKARVSLQIDVAFGDAITPGIKMINFPTLLDMPPAHIQAYSKETVVAEKLQAAVHLGMQNSRMKDLYDLIWLSKLFSFNGALLVKAIQATFKRRKTELPTHAPLFLTETFASDKVKQTQWQAFLRKNGIIDAPDSLGKAIEELHNFLWPLLKVAVSEELFQAQWNEKGPWQIR